MQEEGGVWPLVRRRWLALVVFALLGLVCGSTFILAVTPEYTSKAELFVVAVGADNTSELAQGSDYSEEQARNYSVLATRQAVLDPVITALNLDTDAGDLATRVSASVPLNTSLISISVTDTSPTKSAAIANAIATSLTNVVGKVVPKRSDGTSPVRLQTIQNAVIPTSPSAPNAKLILALGLIGGLGGGFGFLMFRELTGAKIRTPEQVSQNFGLNVLGSITYDRSAAGSPIMSQSKQLSPRAEEFRHIRTNLHFLHAGETHKVFVFTSTIPGEGKSTTSANLAISLAASGSRVCLVEADLRKPSLGAYLDLESSVGLTTVLASDATLEESMQHWGPHDLSVLLSGQIPPNPSELLGSQQTEHLLKKLRNEFDVLIIDCPPLIPVTDAAVIAGLMGGAILVVGCGKVEVRELRKSIDALSGSGSSILGAVINYAPISVKGRYQRVYSQNGRETTRRLKHSERNLDSVLESPHIGRRQLHSR